MISGLIQNLRNHETVNTNDLIAALQIGLKAEYADPLLLEAADIVDQQRENIYGDPVENWTAIAKIVNILLDVAGSEPGVTADDLVMVMQVVKLVRSVRDPNHRDNHLDMIGYSVIRSRLNS